MRQNKQGRYYTPQSSHYEQYDQSQYYKCEDYDDYYDESYYHQAPDRAYNYKQKYQNYSGPNRSQPQKKFNENSKHFVPNKIYSSFNRHQNQSIKEPRPEDETVPDIYFVEQYSNRIRIPKHQPLVNIVLKYKKLENQIIEIQKQLFNNASKGELLTDEQVFIETIKKSLNFTSQNKIHESIGIAEELGIIQRTIRKFSNLKTLSFISLKLEIISYECISWVIKSLKIDDMTPSEKAIQSRVKEAFALRIQTQVWNEVMFSIRDQFSENKNFRPTNENQGSGGKYKIHKEDQQYDDFKSYNQYSFQIIDIEEDPLISKSIKAIYLKNETIWKGVDSLNSDYKINPDLYLLFKQFLFDYFQNELINQPQSVNEEQSSGKWCSSISNALTKQQSNENDKYNYQQRNTSKKGSQLKQEFTQFEETQKAIPGGRYGCAQFIKICGPQKLQELSLGRLAQMVQKAVQDDLLRYHKTLLIWTNLIQNPNEIDQEQIIQNTQKQNILVQKQLKEIQQSLIEILKEFKGGVSLAQLPQHLKRKINFDLDLQSLGFNKFKDLILSMNGQIQIELKSQNHPFAYLATSKLQEEAKPDFKENQYPSQQTEGSYKSFTPKRKYNQRQPYREQQNAGFQQQAFYSPQVGARQYKNFNQRQPYIGEKSKNSQQNQQYNQIQGYHSQFQKQQYLNKDQNRPSDKQQPFYGDKNSEYEIIQPRKQQSSSSFEHRPNDHIGQEVQQPTILTPPNMGQNKTQDLSQLITNMRQLQVQQYAIQVKQKELQMSQKSTDGGAMQSKSSPMYDNFPQTSDSVEENSQQKFISAIDNFRKYSDKQARESASSYTNFTIEDENQPDFKNFENKSDDENARKSSSSVERASTTAQPQLNLISMIKGQVENNNESIIQSQLEDESPNNWRRQEVNINYFIDQLDFNSEEKKKPNDQK